MEANTPPIGVANPRIRRRVQDLWIEQDFREQKNPRKVNVTALDKEPPQVVAVIRELQLGWHFIAHAHNFDEEEFDRIRRQYKQLGYRPMSNFGIFVHDLQALQRFETDPPAKRIPDELIEALFATGHRPRTVGCDIYGVWEGDLLEGAVTNVLTAEYGYVSDLFVKTSFRGHGLGKALMSALLLGTKDRGLKGSVLLSSAAGERIYPQLGYEKIGVMQVFCPSKPK